MRPSKIPSKTRAAPTDFKIILGVFCLPGVVLEPAGALAAAGLKRYAAQHGTKAERNFILFISFIFHLNFIGIAFIFH